MQTTISNQDMLLKEAPEYSTLFRAKRTNNTMQVNTSAHWMIWSAPDTMLTTEDRDFPESEEHIWLKDRWIESDKTTSIYNVSTIIIE